MVYTAIDIAKYVITYCTEKRKPVSNLKLQKMLYYLWIEYYSRTKDFLFADDICAWQFGPVVPNAYYEFCFYAGIPIVARFENNIDKRDIEIIKPIIDSYIPVPASTLVNKSHRDGGAWDAIYQNGVGNRNIIPFSLIQKKECCTEC